MERLAIHNIHKLEELNSELEFERASALYLKLRKMEKENEKYISIRKHLKKLISSFEKTHWEDDAQITDERIRESDLAESIVQAENEFYQKRKVLIKAKLKAANINQTDLAKILGHSKGYMSELINGLRPFSKEDAVVINRLFKIKLEDLIPTFIKPDRAIHIKKTLDALSKSKIHLTEKDFDLQVS
ncbi:MAG: helix-turn-helix domain-containing protein [Flammeovirgaceae bacterium]|nr:helix-turn-helix domain-containing protein [Flammeovirgaceae bacterium]